VLAGLILAAGGCAGDDEPTRRADEFPRGGTLRVATGPLLNEFSPFPFDPQRFSFVPAELHRCCLLRTLLSYTGRPTGAGGAVLRPDLAAALPRVSADGLTWTFSLKRGVRYAPPFGDREIVAADVIRAIERAVRIEADYSSYYHVIEGAQAYGAGRADSISGLEAPDATTFVVHLTRPTGDLGGRMALSAAAPLPPGAAEGHEDYGPFLVASGPYMIEGSQRLDFSLPPTRQKPVSGYRPRRSLTLVRNPSWDASTDPLRPAYVDRIEIEVVTDLDARLREVEAGQLDFLVEAGSPPGYVSRYGRSAELRKRLHRSTFDVTWATWMKLAVPPFDDLRVRRAVNLVVDKERLADLMSSRPYYGGWVDGDVTGHLVPDSLQNNLLLDYDPHETPGHRGT
jgi:peptide/nickel transport system substrate-binding protein